MPDTAANTAIDPMKFREVLGHYPTGVALITGIADDGAAIGMVVGTFTSVSLDPPLVAFLPTKSSHSFERLRTAAGFTVNILAHDQEDLCRQLARPATDKFAGLAWTPSSTGAPILDGVVASIDCTFHSILDGGDHHIVLGSVQELEVHRPVAPLIFFQGGYGGFTPRSFMVPTDQELASGVTLAQEVRSAMEVLAEEIGAEVTAFARIGSDVATVATAAGKDMGTTAVLGARFPLMPPLGELFVAWEDQSEVDAWVARAFGADEATQDLFRSRLETARRKGWALSFHSESSDNDLLEAMRDYGRGELTPARQRAVTQTIVGATDRYRVHALEAGETYDVDAIMAPVRNAAGEVQLVLRLSQLPAPATSERVQTWAQQLTSAANEASARIAKAG